MNRKLILSFFITAAIFCSCQKNIDVFVPNAGQLNGPDTAWYNSIADSMPVSSLKNTLLLSTFKKDIQIGSHADSATTTNGLNCIFPDTGYLNTSGLLIHGQLSSELLLLKKKGDMIRMNKPTVSANRLLVSTAEVFVGLKDTQNITLASSTQLKLKINDAGAIANNIAFFYGEDQSGGGFNWSVNNDPTHNFITANAVPFQMTTNRLKWTCSAYFFDTSNVTRNTLSILLPSNYTNANTIMYVVFKDIRSVVEMKADVAGKKFSTFKLPDGKAITVIAISHQANDYYLGTISLTTGASTTVTLSPIKSNLVNINTVLDNL